MTLPERQGDGEVTSVGFQLRGHPQHSLFLPIVAENLSPRGPVCLAWQTAECVCVCVCELVFACLSVHGMIVYVCVGQNAHVFTQWGAWETCMFTHEFLGGHSPLPLLPLYACVSLHVCVFLAPHTCPCEHV